MKRIEFAHEILSESRRSTQVYLESGRDYDKVKANMYSIFECYAHGLITWNQVRPRWHDSIVEYLNLYADRPDLFLSEGTRMLGEYETTLQTFKPALDEYKRVNEQKMVSNIVIKGKLNESQAKEHSNVYFNRRALKESELKDTTTMKTWKRVQESYPNLTSKDEMRIRMLTVFEGSTVDTTKLVTTYMSEEPTTISGPMQTSMRPKPRPANLGNTSTVDSASIDAAVKQALGQGTAPTTSPRPMPRPAGQSIGAGSQVAYMDNGAVDGSTRGIDPADAYSPEDLARLTGQPAPSLAPKTSPRPMPRPTTLKQSANNNIRKEAAAIFSKIKANANEGYKVLPPMDKERYDEIPGLEGPFTTLSGKVVYYDPKEGAYYDRDTDMYLSNDEYTALNSDYSGMQDERDINVREADEEAEKQLFMDPDDKMWKVSYDHGPHQSNTIKVKAKSQSHAWEVAKEVAKEKYGHARITSGSVTPVKEETEVDESDFKQRQSVNGLKKMIDDHDARARNTTSPLKKDHHRKMSQQLRDQLADMTKETEVDEGAKEKVKGVIRRAMKNDLPFIQTRTDYAHNKAGEAYNKGDKKTGDRYMKYWDKNKRDGLGEETEVDEVSNDLKSRYIDNAKTDIANRKKLVRKSDALARASNYDNHSYFKNKKESDAQQKKIDSRKEMIGKAKASMKEESELDEAGAFSYGKKPRKGTVAYNAAEQRKKQEKNEKPIEPKDQKVGNAKVTKESVAESYTGRETKDGTWRVFKTGDAVAVAGPFKSKEEASAWIKKQSVKEKVKESVINEAVTLDYSRYMRAHGKKPRDAGYAGVWMFTTSEFGDPSENETFEFRGSFADAKKAAAKWAKSQGENRFYVME